MSARARTAAGSREHGRPRAVAEVFSANPPQQTPAQSHSYPFLLSLRGSVCVEFVACCLVFNRTSGSTFVLHADPGVRIITAARRPFYLAIHTGISFRFFISQKIRSPELFLSVTCQPSRGRRNTSFLQAAAALPVALHGCTASFVTVI